MSTKIRLIIMNFLQFAVWGAYLISMGQYLVAHGLSSDIGWFYSMQGIVSLFMPALLGIVADRWVPAQRLLGFCHLTTAIFMCATGYYGSIAGDALSFSIIFPLYSVAVAFYMPTLALSNSVAYTVLQQARMDTIKTFPPIRVFGTIGFICAMWLIDLIGYQSTYQQFYVSAFFAMLLFVYCQFMLPNCPVSKSEGKKTLVDSLGLRAFKLFKKRQMALFFLFSFMLGVSLQITNAWGSPFIFSFSSDPAMADTFGVNHANLLISLSQISETLCILLIPFFMSRFGIKKVMLIAMLGWVGRFAFLGLGDPGAGVPFLILSMLVYGVAFDFFNVSGSLYVNEMTDKSIRSSAQGLFVIVTNGFGATLGTLGAQYVVDAFTHDEMGFRVGDWPTVWFIFAGYSLVVAIAFAILFKYKHDPSKKQVPLS